MILYFQWYRGEKLSTNYCFCSTQAIKIYCCHDLMKQIKPAEDANVDSAVEYEYSIVFSIVRI